MLVNVGGKWYKEQYLDEHYYEPYIQCRFKNEKKRTSPFSFLHDNYAPMMSNLILCMNHDISHLDRRLRSEDLVSIHPNVGLNIGVLC